MKKLKNENICYVYYFLFYSEYQAILLVIMSGKTSVLISTKNIMDLQEELLLLLLTTIYDTLDTNINMSNIYVLLHVCKKFYRIATTWFNKLNENKPSKNYNVSPYWYGKKSLLTWACSFKSNKRSDDGENELIRWAKKIVPNYTIDCMSYAIKCANVPLIEKFIKMKLTNEYCLRTAIRYGHIDIYKHMLTFGYIDHNLTVNKSNESKIIDEMAKQGCTNMLRVLLRKGHRNNGHAYRTALESSLTTGKTKFKIIKLLFQYATPINTDEHPCSYALLYLEFDILNWLIQTGFPTNYCKSFMIKKLKYMPAIKILLENNIKIESSEWHSIFGSVIYGFKKNYENIKKYKDVVEYLIKLSRTSGLSETYKNEIELIIEVAKTKGIKIDV